VGIFIVGLVSGISPYATAPVCAAALLAAFVVWERRLSCSGG
jgi:hypothetical protein